MKNGYSKVTAQGKLESSGVNNERRATKAAIEYEVFAGSG
jgi:hypothetical protein